MSYVITSNGYGPGHCVSRWYIDNYRARDFIAPVSRVYGRRLVPSEPLTFDTLEWARYYKKHNTDLVPDTWKVTGYNPCMNALVNEVFD